MKQKARFDNSVLFLAIALVTTGIVMVYSSSAIIAAERFGNEYFFLKRQALFAAFGILIMLVIAKINHQLYRKTVYGILAISFLSLIAVLLPGIGVTTGGSTRWLRFGTFSIQPSEFSKLALIIYFAWSLSKKGENIKAFSIGVLPHLIITGIMISLIIVQPDMGTAICIGAVAFALLFISGVRLYHLSLILFVAAPLIYLLIVRVPYRLRRWTAFINPWDDPSDSGFQAIQSIYAFGSGGIFGRGLGDGKQKLFFLPEPHTDFIFSVIGEELGFVGVASILAIFFVLIYRGIRIALSATDLFSSYLALGITILLGSQAMIHMGVTMVLLPTKGISLPFISYGGSALLTSLIGVGILLNISSGIKKG